jgi:phosphoserine phosphatase
LRYFSEELFEEVLKPAIFPARKNSSRSRKKSGQKQIVITGALDFTIKNLTDYLGVDEFKGKSTGICKRLRDGQNSAAGDGVGDKSQMDARIRRKNDINLSESYAYSDSISDLPMLSIVGHPVAVNPDFRLKQTALQHDWAI